MSINPLNNISKIYLEQVANQEVELEEGMSMKDFKANRRKLKRREASADAEKRGHVGKEWYNSGRKYSPDEAKRMRSKLDDEERSTRHRSAIDPEGDDSNYSADKTKNPKKLRKQKAMGESAVPGKPAEKLGAVTAIPQDEREAARQRTLAKAAAIRAKKGIKTEALDPVGKEDADVDNDGKKNTKKDKYLLNRRQAISQSIATQKEAKEVKRWWDDDGDGKGYEEGEVSGKFKRKKKSIQTRTEEFIREVSAKDMGGKESDQEKISEKSVKNKITINPNINIDEAVENLGGQLIETVEFEGILDSLSNAEIIFLEDDLLEETVYETFSELFDEGHSIEDIKESLLESIDASLSILSEAKVTYGHDTKVQRRTGKLKKIASAVKSAVKAEVHRNRYKGAGKAEGPTVARRVASSLKSGLKKAVAKGARAVAKGAIGVARKAEKSAPKQAARKPATYRAAGAGTKEKVSSGSYKAPEKKKAEPVSDPWEGSATAPPKAKAKKVAAKPKAKAPAATKKRGKSKLDSLLADIRKEETQLAEKTLSSAETKKKEEIVKSMKSKAADFEKRYPGRGKEVMYATATKVAKKVAEQAMELQPKTSTSSQQQSQKPDPALEAKKKQSIAMQKQIEMKKLQLLSKGVELPHG